MLSINMLQSFAVSEPINWPSQKVRALFVYLAVHSDTPVPRAQLATLLWGGFSESAAKASLRTSLSRLKQALQPITIEMRGELLSVTRDTVQLNSIDNEIIIDVVQYEAAWHRFVEAKRTGAIDSSVVIETLADAVEQYQGSFLDDFVVDDCLEFEEWMISTRSSYHQRVLALLQHLSQFHVEHLDLDAAEKYALRQIELEEWCEPAHRQLMQIYFAAGQRTKAIAQFKKCKAILLEKLSVEPGEETIAVYEEIVASQTVNQHNLPFDLDSFFGRSAETNRLHSLIDESAARLITLHGVGGIGKTRLARAFAMTQIENFEDGVWLIEFAQASSAEAMPRLVFQALGLRFSSNDSIQTQLLRYLRPRNILLIFDNLEHLVNEDSTVAFLLELLQFAPNLTIIVTSRLLLNIRGETVVRVLGLAYPPDISESDWLLYPAIQLFVARMKQVDATFRPETMRKAIIQICQMVEGLPLGIELVAAQSHIWSCEAVAARLMIDSEVETPLRDVPQRQRNLRSVFEYSWELLDGHLQKILAKTAILSGKFTIEAFQAITKGSHQDIQKLLAHALVQIAGNGQYKMHQLVRHFALEALDSAELISTRSAHAVYYLNYIAHFENVIYGDLEPTIQSIKQEWGHIELAWSWALAYNIIEPIYRALVPLVTFWEIGGWTIDAVPMLETAQRHFAAANTQPKSMQATISRLKAVHMWQQFITSKPQLAFLTAVNLLETHSPDADPFVYAMALLVKGAVLYYTCQLDAAEKLLAEAYRLCEQHELRHWQYAASLILTIMLANNQQLEKAEFWHHSTLASNKKNTTRFWELGEKGWLAIWKWQFTEGIESMERQMNIFHQLGRTIHGSMATTTSAFARYKLGMFDESIQILHYVEQSVQARSDIAFSMGGLYVLSLAYRRLDDIDKSLHYGRIASEQTTVLNTGFAHIWSCNAYALALCKAEQPTEAQHVLTTVRDKMMSSELSENWYLLIEGTLAYSHAVAREWDKAYSLADKLYDRFFAADSIYTRMEQLWFCYEILSHFNDPRAKNLLGHAHTVLQFRASQISDNVQRSHFLNNFPEHLQILAAAD